MISTEKLIERTTITTQEEEEEEGAGRSFHWYVWVSIFRDDPLRRPFVFCCLEIVVLTSDTTV